MRGSIFLSGALCVPLRLLLDGKEKLTVPFTVGDQTVTKPLAKK